MSAFSDIFSFLSVCISFLSLLSICINYLSFPFVCLTFLLFFAIFKKFWMQKQLCRKKSLFAALSVEHFHGRKTPGLVWSRCIHKSCLSCLSVCLSTPLSIPSLVKSNVERKTVLPHLFFTFWKRREREREKRMNRERDKRWRESFMDLKRQICNRDTQQTDR